LNLYDFLNIGVWQGNAATPVRYGGLYNTYFVEREIFIRMKQATKRDMPIKPGAYCLATYQWYSIQTKIKQKQKAKGEKCNTKATKTQEYGKYSTMNEYRLSVCYVKLSTFVLAVAVALLFQ